MIGALPRDLPSHLFAAVTLHSFYRHASGARGFASVGCTRLLAPRMRRCKARMTLRLVSDHAPSSSATADTKASDCSFPTPRNSRSAVALFGSELATRYRL